jgi:hypothetical protein
LFWTVPLEAPDGVDVQWAAGKGRMTATDLALEDYFNLPNAFFRFLVPASASATCNFDIRWTPPVTDRSGVTSPDGSVGDLVLCNATMTWSASNAQGFSFTSDPEGTTSAFAQLGKVRNGVFA